MKEGKAYLDDFVIFSITSVITLDKISRQIPFNCENEYLVLALGKETATQAVVHSIVWAFCRLKMPRCQEMSARSYALHSI